MKKISILLLCVLLIVFNMITVCAGSRVIIVAPNALSCPDVPLTVASPVYPGYGLSKWLPQSQPFPIVPENEIIENVTEIEEINNQQDAAFNVELSRPLILMYHRLSDELTTDAFTITSAMFEEDVKTLKAMGFAFGGADELNKAYENNSQSKLVVITFDDGYESDYTIAKPILEKYDACATFFIIGSNIGKEGYMSEEQVIDLGRSKAAHIGNHSYEIHDLPYEEVQALYDKTPRVIINDFLKNQQLVSKLANKAVITYSFPYGIYNDYIVTVMKGYGITCFSSIDDIDYVKPYGRFNRTGLSTLQEIIARAQKSAN